MNSIAVDPTHEQDLYICGFETGSRCIAPAGLELTLYQLWSQIHRDPFASICRSLLSAGIVKISAATPSKRSALKEKVFRVYECLACIDCVSSVKRGQERVMDHLEVELWAVG